MSMTGLTTNELLPVGKNTDVVSIFDVNTICEKVDELVHELQSKDTLTSTDIEQIQTKLTDLTTKLTTVTQTASTNATNVSALQNSISSLNESLTEIGKLTRIGVISLNAPVNVNLAQYRKAYLCIEIDNYVYDFHPIPVDFLNITKRISASYFYGTSNYITASLDLSKTNAVLVDYDVVGFSTVKIALYGEK